jgi:hypothetical protein
MEEWSYSSSILDLSNWWRWVISFTHWLLYPRYPLDRRLGGPRVGLDAVERSKILQCRESNQGRPAHSPSLYRLRYMRLVQGVGKGKRPKKLQAMSRNVQSTCVWTQWWTCPYVTAVACITWHHWFSDVRVGLPSTLPPLDYLNTHRQMLTSSALELVNISEMFTKHRWLNIYQDMNRIYLRMYGRPQWPRGLKHEMSPSAWTLGLWVRVPHQTLMSVCVYSLILLSSVYGEALRQGWYPV